jgi:mannose-6-phosphate isomerase-like protein (cupin superfamily)
MSRKFQNVSEREAVFIEVQTGEYFGEDDIERLADGYGSV